MLKVLVALSLAAVPAFAQTAAAQTAAPAAAPMHYTTADTDVGTLIDDPASKAIVDKYLPGFSTNPQIAMARPMTLRAIQPFAPDKVSDDALAKIDVDLAKLPVKK